MIARKAAFRRASGLLTGAALLAWSASSGAQNAPAAVAPPAQPTPAQVAPAAPAVPAAPQYQVEVLIFANRDFDRTEEQFENEVVTPRAPDELRAPPVFDDTTFEPLAQTPAPGAVPDEAAAPGDPSAGLPPAGGDPFATEQGEFRFRLLRPEELQLSSQYRILQRNPQAYAPLLHGGWVQPGLPEDEARPFDLAMLGATNPVGSIRLYLSRFLHVNLDLSYRDTPAAAPADPSAPANELAELPLTPRYHLEADRTTRSGELHYFDHPAFGVLIRVTPIRPEQTPPGAPGSRPAA